VIDHDELRRAQEASAYWNKRAAEEFERARKTPNARR
jgi:hypothetical protein